MKYLICAVLGMCCFVAPLENCIAQTIFTWPDTEVDLKGYHYFENCAAVGARVASHIKDISKDTVFLPRGQLKKPTPEKVQRSVRECLSVIPASQVPREYIMMASGLYLRAGMLDEAESIIRQGLDQIPTTDTASRSALIDSVVQRYLKGAPTPFRIAQAWIDTLELYGASYSPLNLLANYYWLMRSAYLDKLDSLAIWAGNRVIDLAPMAKKSASGGEAMAIRIATMGAIRITQEKELLEQLRKGTAHYATTLETRSQEILGFSSGEPVRNLEASVLGGDYWFPSSAATQEYPKKGQLTLIGFVPDRMSGPMSASYMRALRWLTQKYPTIDLVLVTGTHGAFGTLEPPPSDREAFLADSLFRNFHRLNPIVTVTKGTFIQFDPPDNRRFYLRYPNLDAYPPRGMPFRGDPKIWQLILVDENRRIVDLLDPDEFSQDIVTHIIDTLLARIAEGGRQ